MANLLLPRFLIGDPAVDGSYKDTTAYLSEKSSDKALQALALDPIAGTSHAVKDIREVSELMKVLESPKTYIQDYLKDKKTATAECAEIAKADYEAFMKKGYSQQEAKQMSAKIFETSLKAKFDVIDTKYDGKLLKQAKDKLSFTINAQY